MLRIKISFIVSILIILFFNSCSKENKQVSKQTKTLLKVETITIESKNIPIWARFTGKTKASSHQEVYARISGILEKIYFKDGQYVKKGDKLFKIEQDQYIASLNAAKAQKKQDEASFLLAKANVNRYIPLVKEGLAPRATLEEYQAKLTALKALIQKDNAQIKQAKIKLNYTIIKAPISGKIGARRVDIGNLVGQNSSTLLTTIMKIDPIYAYFSPSQNDLRVIQKYKDKNNLNAFIELDNSIQNIRLNGYVDFLDNIIDPLTSTITMRVIIDNPRKEILPGTFIYVNIFISDKYKFKAIPPEIIFNDQLGKYVYIVDNNSTLKRVDITTGYSTRYYTTVEKGLKDGDKVVISSLIKLKPKLKVNTTDVTKSKGIDAILKKNKLIPSKR